MSEATNVEAPNPADDPMNYLYAKSITCPVCGVDFMDFVLRRSRLRQLGTDTDFRIRFRGIDTNLYEVILCSNCGYAATQNNFTRISSKQQDMIKEKITPNHKYKEFSMPMSQADALERYKKALACYQAINAKSSQLAILFLKMSWIYRDAKDFKSEATLLRHAFVKLKEAYTSEAFPLGSMDEPTAKYMIAEIARRLGDFDEALKLVGDLIVNRSTPSGIKERAQDMKETIRETREAEARAKAEAAAKAAAAAAAAAGAPS